MYKKREMVDEQWNSLHDLMELNCYKSYNIDLDHIVSVS